MMKQLIFAIAGLMLPVACTGSTQAPPATAVPQVSTPGPTREWDLLGIATGGEMVTVSLSVFAGIAVRVTLDGNRPSRVDDSFARLDFVFENVAPGEHAIAIRDVVGFIEMTSVTVDAPQPDNGGLPDWLALWVADLDAGRVEFPPQSITKYESRGETVYYVVQQCCDQFSDLLDAGGGLIGHPDGGITGGGDGVTLFFPSSLDGEEIWPGN